MIFDQHPFRHVPFILIDSDENECQRAIRFRSEIEANASASLLREDLIDHFAREMPASLRQRLRTAA